LFDKASGIIRSRIGKVREAPDGAVPDAENVLNEIHILARRAPSSNVLASISGCSLYVLRVMMRSQQASVIATYNASLEDYMTRKTSSLNTQFFLDFIQRFPKAGWNMRERLVELTPHAINTYRKVQAIRMLQLIVSHVDSLVLDAHFPLFCCQLTLL
jgi:DNA polymerase phi